MSTQEAIVVVLIGAIFANVALSVGLMVGPRLRARREAHESALREAAGMGPGSRAGSLAVSAPRGALPRALGGRPVPGGLGPPFAPRLVGPREPAPPASLSPVDSVDAPTDGATGLDLAPTWSKWLSEEESRIDRYGRPATIVLFELGGLDRLAERLGPEAAERLIPPIATTVRRHARASDNIARLGHARFGALLTETDEIRAINYVERIRSACDVWLESGAVALRLSIGWAEIAASQPVEVAVQAAERRLNEDRQRLPLADPALDAESDVQAAMQARA